MKISLFKDGAEKDAQLNHLLLESSFELHTGDDLKPLIEKIGDANYVLLGEVHNFYALFPRSIYYLATMILSVFKSIPLLKILTR